MDSTIHLLNSRGQITTFNIGKNIDVIVSIL